MEQVTDAKGRKLTLRKITVLDQVRLLRAIGPAQSSNEPYVNIVTMAASVSDIGGVPLPFPRNEAQIDAAIERIGDEGFVALTVSMKAEIAALEAAAADAIADAGGKEDPLAPSA